MKIPVPQDFETQLTVLLLNPTPENQEAFKARFGSQLAKVTEERDISKLAVELSTPWEKAVLADAEAKVRKATKEMAELEGKLLLAAQQIELAEACVKGLEQWKREALQVLNRCNTQKLGKLLGMPLGVDIPSNLETYVAKLLGERDAWKASANFHRERGITLLDAKWLDPRCHKGCQSLVLESRVTSARQAADLLHDAVQAYLDPHQDIQPADAKREMRIALAAYESEREMSS